MSNNAAAALAFPVAVGVGRRLCLDPAPFVMATVHGASCSFLTPHGYQTNLMVMSPGRHTPGDFVRAGLPVALVFIAVTLVAVPLFFPFVPARWRGRALRALVECPAAGSRPANNSSAASVTSKLARVTLLPALITSCRATP